jgi:hypothetical protein
VAVTRLRTRHVGRTGAQSGAPVFFRPDLFRVTCCQRVAISRSSLQSLQTGSIDERRSSGRLLRSFRMRGQYGGSKVTERCNAARARTASPAFLFPGRQGNNCPVQPRSQIETGCASDKRFCDRPCIAARRKALRLPSSLLLQIDLRQSDTPCLGAKYPHPRIAMRGFHPLDSSVAEVRSC